MGAIALRPVARTTKAIRDLLDLRRFDHVRSRALTKLEKSILDDEDARDAVLLCILHEPWEELRERCVRAIEPAARAHVPTQRALLLAMRNEVDEVVLSSLVSLTSGFVGLSRKECIETWLELLSSAATPSSVSDQVAALLRAEGDVPNLEHAVAKCLRLDAIEITARDRTSDRHLGWGHRACSRLLMQNVPAPRRLTIASSYLERLSVSDDREAHEVTEMLESLKAQIPDDPAFRELLLRSAERRSIGLIRGALIRAYGHSQKGPASEAAIERLANLAKDTRLTEASVNAILAIAYSDPCIRPFALGALRHLKDVAHFIPQLMHYRDSDGSIQRDPNAPLVDAIETLEAGEDMARLRAGVRSVWTRGRAWDWYGSRTCSARSQQPTTAPIMP
jgi:hypothetical protein